MFFYILFLEIVYGSQLYSSSNGSIETQIFKGCTYSGSNFDYVLFQCIQHNVFVSKLEFTHKIIAIHSIERKGESQLSNYLVCDLITNNEQYILEIRRVLTLEQSNLIYQEYNLIFYELTQIDSIRMMISILKKEENQKYIIEMHQMFPGKVNQFSSISYKFKSDDNGSILGFSQYYNKIRNALLLIVLKQNQIKLIEYSLFDKQFRDVSTYILYEYDIPLKWKIYSSGYIIITYDQFQVLYSIGEILYEIQQIHIFDSQPLQMIKNFNGIDSNYILQQNMNGIKLFIIEEISNLYQQKVVQEIQQFNVSYSNIAFYIDKAQLLLIYDHFETEYINIDQFKMDKLESYVLNVSKLLSQKNYQSIQYQQEFDQQYYSQLKFDKQQSEYQFPCDVIYKSLNISLIPYKSECIFESLYNYFLHGCKKLNNCYSCMSQTGCEWIENQCQSEQNYESLSLNQIRESSKWFVKKIIKCGQEIDYNQTYYGNISKGTVFTLFYDAQKQQKFHLLFNLQVQEKRNINFIQQNICLGNDSGQLCNQIKINDYESQLILKGKYFRVTFVFLEDIIVNDLTITVRQQNVQEGIDYLKLWKLISLLSGVIILFAIIIYIANRRINYLVSLTFQNGQQNLDNESLSNMMENMIKEQVLIKQSFQKQILRYDDDKCPFCIEKYEIKQEIIQIFCGHTFHLECFEDWIRINTKLVRCPICNQTIEYFLKNKEQFKKSINV
ncbi:unnamed protein product [Paramecium sonneborni]|uniref:RING-type domain-containing protein n=1 Tax=Paramecium sonneborni TaxID=65129 RepID=A0A8S1LX04_9CILI|nr:unnamed protein product [Paramecium sonneborni]